MGTKYSTQTITGYNTSPPPDDGTQVASNLVTWAGQKTKLADPIKTLVESINTALVADLNYSSRAVTSTDAVLATDHKKTLQCSGTFTETLLDAATAGAGFHVWIKNNGTGIITVDRATATDTVDSVSSVVTLFTLESSLFVVNAAANGYLRLVGGSTPDTSPIVHGATDKTKRIRVEADGLTTNTTRVWTARDADFDIGAATQAEQEAASSLVASVTPGRQQFHPSAAKAWVNVGISGDTNASYNVTSVSDTGTGQITVNFTTAFSSVNYVTFCNTQYGDGTNPANYVSNTSPPATGSVRLDSVNAASAAASDPVKWNVVCFGDQ